MIAESGSSYLLSPRARSSVDGEPVSSGRELLLARQGVANLVGEYHGDLATQFAESTSRLKRENEPSKRTVVTLWREAQSVLRATAAIVTIRLRQFLWGRD
jgi:hypothetical protein